MLITVAVVTTGRPEALNKLLVSVLSAQKATEIEVLVLINEPCLVTESLLKEYQDKHVNIRLLKSHRCSRGKTRNILIENAKGDIIYFLDDDVMVQKNTFMVLLDKFEQYTNVDILGGPNITPEKSSLFQKGQGAVLSSFFGTLWVSQRYRQFGRDRIANDNALILCNLAIKINVFLEKGVFLNSDIICAEENVLLKELSRKGCIAMFIPSLAVYHERRNGLLSFCNQIFTYGRGRFQVINYFFRVRHLIYLVPMAPLVYSLFLISTRRQYLFVGFYSYCLLDFINSVYIGFKAKGSGISIMSFFIFPVIHASYLAGFLAELCNSLFKAIGKLFAKILTLYRYKPACN